MTDEVRTVVRFDVRAAVESLRSILAAIDAGELGADEVQRAYLEGAVDALERLTR